MATYMKIDGVKGSVTDEGQQGSIAVDGTTMVTHRKIIMRPGRTTNRETNYVNHEELELTKDVDLSSCDLKQAYYKNTVYPTVTIEMCRIVDGVITPAMTYVLSNAMISQYNEVSDGEGLPVETLRFNFTKIETHYLLKDNKNQPLPRKSIGFNLVDAKSC